MRILQIYNEFRSLCGGEEPMVNLIKYCLEKEKFQVSIWKKSSRAIGNNYIAKGKAFFSSIFNIFTYREAAGVAQKQQPDLVHVHNIYPLFSPSILIAFKRHGVPIVMSVHNCLFTCPAWYHFNNGKVCELCFGGSEYWCVLKNCRNDFLESLAYAIRSAIARKLHLFHKNVDLFIALTEFTKKRMIRAGFDKMKIKVVPNAISVPKYSPSKQSGSYIAYSGRISPEKGISILITAAKKSRLPVLLAGDLSQMAFIKNELPSNVKWVGLLKEEELDRFYYNARFLIVPSICLETFPVAAIEAMGRSLPVLASRVGGLPYVIDDGINGLLYEPSNVDELVNKMNYLWNNNELCIKMGKEARIKAISEYNEDSFKERLISAYKEAIDLSKASETPY